jgi:hypothetical protein
LWRANGQQARSTEKLESYIDTLSPQLDISRGYELGVYMASQTEQISYEIKVRGELHPVWMEWFEGLLLTHDCEGNTVLTGPIVDHTALHSILLKIRDLNLKLISVNEVESSSNEISQNNHEKETLK